MKDSVEFKNLPCYLSQGPRGLIKRVCREDTYKGRINYCIIDVESAILCGASSDMVSNLLERLCQASYYPQDTENH